MFTMIRSLNSFTRLQGNLNDRLVRFMKKCPLLDVSVIRRKALQIAADIGMDSYVGSFAGLWALLSKTSIKVSRKLGSLPAGYSSYYDQLDGEREDEILEEIEEPEIENVIELPENDEPIEIAPDLQEYVMEMVHVDDINEEIVFLDEQSLQYELIETDERGTKRLFNDEENENFDVSKKKSRNNFQDDEDFDFQI